MRRLHHSLRRPHPTDRIEPINGGVTAFISNGSWLDGNAQDGFSASLAKDFDKIHIFNLRGNQRTSGELSRREGGKIFGNSSQTPIAATLLVRYPESRHGDGRYILYHDIGDHIAREDLIFAYKEDSITEALYRPFCKQRLCCQKELIERTCQQTRLSTSPGVHNLQICVSGIGLTKDLSCIITGKVPDIELIGKSQ
ncbi:MAG: hypothetical protein LUD72_13265 [Bacteroidales bacterium]|nr:hypothetical protein [Bacteroidales bacterium]